jgi:hypothetical protein
VFGIGLSRTATRSLTLALRRSGLRAVHYPFDLVTERELFGGAPRLTVLEANDAMLDLPAACFFAELDARYPGSKFILTARPAEEWVDAVVDHYERLLAGWPDQPRRFRDFSERITERAYGSFPPTRDGIAAGGERHLGHVAEHFRERPADLLTLDLCHDAAAGGPKLAAFLGSADGAGATAFPHADDDDETMLDGVERTLFKEEMRT